MSITPDKHTADKNSRDMRSKPNPHEPIASTTSGAAFEMPLRRLLDFVAAVITLTSNNPIIIERNDPEKFYQKKRTRCAEFDLRICAGLLLFMGETGALYLYAPAGNKKNTGHLPVAV
jgi:hypothetical protein